MNRDDIIKLARQAGLIKDWMVLSDEESGALASFAALVAAAERKAILQISADNWFKTQWEYDDAIRARGGKNDQP